MQRNVNMEIQNIHRFGLNLYALQCLYENNKQTLEIIFRPISDNDFFSTSEFLCVFHTGQWT